MRGLLDEARRRNAQATLITSESKETQVSFEFNRLKKIESTESLRHSLQVIKDGRLGMAGSTRPGGEGELLEKALNVAEYGSAVSYEFPKQEPHGDPRVYDQNVADFKVDDMIAIGEELVDYIKSFDPSINGMVGLGKGVTQRSIRNTLGLDASLRKTTVQVAAGFQHVEGQNLLSSFDWDVSTSLEYDLDRIKAKIREDFDMGRKNVSVEPGTYDVLFTPSGFSDIIRPIAACLDGRAVMRGISPFKDRLGEQILDPAISLIEDGTLDGGLGSDLYDGQGVACRRTPLIEDGVLCEYLLDLESAHRLGRRPIGTGAPSGASPNNLLVLPGHVPYEDLLKGIRRGIIIDQTMGAWAGNPYTGMVSGNIALGFLVVDGKKVGRVKDCMFSLNVFTHLKSNVLGLSKETKNLGEGILPYCLIGGVSVAGRGS